MNAPRHPRKLPLIRLRCGRSVMTRHGVEVGIEWSRMPEADRCDWKTPYRHHLALLFDRGLLSDLWRRLGGVIRIGSR